MALFSKKETTEKKVQTVSAVPSRASNHTIAHILSRPRITEKATMHATYSAYVFDVASRATKRDIVGAISSIYKVTPLKIRIVHIPTKQVRNARTGRRGVKRGGKKAYVYLKKGETITLQ